MTDATAHPVRDIVDRLHDAADRDRVRLRDVVEAFGETSFLPMLMVPALLVLSPLSGIPFFSSVCGLTIVFISAQMLWPGRDHLWLPDFLMRQQVDGEKARGAARRLRRLADWLDGHTRDRFHVLVSRPFRPQLEAICLLCGAAMPVMEFVPFSSSILGLAVLCFCTAMLARDGLFVVLGFVVMGIAAMVPVTVVWLL